MHETAVEARIEGRVQGVGFRAWTRSRARARGLRGWVRNEPDGTVSAFACGPEADVAALLRELRQGPPGAKVTSVETSAAAPSGLGDFEIRY